MRARIGGSEGLAEHVRHTGLLFSVTARHLVCSLFGCRLTDVLSEHLSTEEEHLHRAMNGILPYLQVRKYTTPLQAKSYCNNYVASVVKLTVMAGPVYSCSHVRTTMISFGGKQVYLLQSHSKRLNIQKQKMERSN